MRTPLNKALRTILEGTIDASIGRKERLRTEAEDRLHHIKEAEQVATSDLVALFRALLDIQRQQDSIAADRYNLLRY
jgi:hypothetical protein